MQNLHPRAGWGFCKLQNLDPAVLARVYGRFGARVSSGALMRIAPVSQVGGRLSRREVVSAARCRRWIRLDLAEKGDS